MPREVKAFACDFGCHRNVTTSRKRMADHEARCFHNPTQKACATCRHLKFEWEEQYMGHQFGEAVYGNSYKVNYCEQEIDIAEKLRSGCPEWKSLPDPLQAINKQEREAETTDRN